MTASRNCRGRKKDFRVNYFTQQRPLQLSGPESVAMGLTCVPVIWAALGDTMS